MSARLDIITYNTRHGLHQRDVDEDMLRLSELNGTQYYAFQEVHGVARSDRLVAFWKSLGFGVIRLNRIAGDYKTPIVYRPEAKQMVTSGSEYLCGPVGEEGAGPATKVDKRATWGLFEDLSSGANEVIINCHLPASPHIFQRGTLHKEAVTNLTQFAKRMRNKYEADVTIVGDMNTDYYKIRGKARFNDLMKSGFSAHFDHFPKGVPTFPSKKLYIDWVISNMVPKSAETMLTYNSDHRPVRVRY